MLERETRLICPVDLSIPIWFIPKPYFGIATDRLATVVEYLLVPRLIKFESYDASQTQVSDVELGYKGFCVDKYCGSMYKTSKQE